jgi:hypothetical protein
MQINAANTIHTIEIEAMQGKALASLLEAACASEDFCPEEVGIVAYSLQRHFLAILEALDTSGGSADGVLEKKPS